MLDRLRRLTVAEMACRGRQEASKWIDRIGPSTPLDSRAAGDAVAAMERFVAVKAPSLFDGQVARAIEQRWPDHCADVVARAAGICDRRFRLLGYEDLWFGDPVDWHLDPVAGRRAPRVHWSRVHPLEPAEVGDSKVIWELSRHQWMVTLAQAYRLTGDARFSHAAAELLESWLTANPRGVGINWTSSLEAAFRIIAWSWAIALFHGAPVLRQKPFATLGGAIRDHASHIERYLSYYFSPNTHLTGEALGLFYAGVLFDQFPEAGRWRDLGWRILLEQLPRQTLSDGIYFEQATCYQRYTAEIYLHFVMLAARGGRPAPPQAIAGLERLLESLQHICDADGRMPSIGDADGGWLLPVESRQPQDCRGVFGTAGVVCGRSDFAWLGQSAPEVGWLLGRAGLACAERRPAAPPRRSASRAFAAGGCAVLRAGWNAEDPSLILDAGPLGCPATGAHGHADLLSIHCSAFGRDWIADSGTFSYTVEPAWRSYFRGTAAHSTVVIDGESQAEPAGPFAWRWRPAARLRAWSSTEEADFADADHDAYARLADPVVHRRRVLFVKPRYWLIVDDLSGADVHDVDVRFQLTARPVMRSPQSVWVGKGGIGLWIAHVSTTRLRASVRAGSLMPIDGWRSPNYGQREASPVLSLFARARLPVRVVTLLVPSRAPEVAPRIDVDAVDAAGRIARIVLPDFAQAIVIDADSGVLEVHPCAAS